MFPSRTSRPALSALLHRLSIVFPSGMDFGSLCIMVGTLLLCKSSISLCYHNRGEAVRVARVVVVDVACRIDIPDIISIAAVSRTQTDILRVSLHPFIVSYAFP